MFWRDGSRRRSELWFLAAASASPALPPLPLPASVSRHQRPLASGPPPTPLLCAVTNTGQNVAASALGATSVWSVGTQYPGQSNTYGNDLFTDPYLAYNNGNSPQLIAGLQGAGTWIVTFPVTNPELYPFGEPAPISSVVIVNRVDQPTLNLYARMNGANVALMAANYSMLSNATIVTSPTMATVLTVNFRANAQTGPIYPNSSLAPSSVAALQASPVNQATYVRYIQIAAAPGQCLYFRE